MHKNALIHGEIEGAALLHNSVGGIKNSHGITAMGAPNSITNFSKKDAEELCHRLKKENKSCIVVNIKNDTTLTLAKK